MYLKTALRFAKPGDRFRRSKWSLGQWITVQADLTLSPGDLTIDDLVESDWRHVNIKSIRELGTRIFHLNGATYKKIGNNYYQLSGVVNLDLGSMVQV